MKKLFTLLLLIVLSSCIKKQDKPTEESCSSDVENTKSSKFKMYEMSEMSALMEQMYVDNQRLKDRILKDCRTPL